MKIYVAAKFARREEVKNLYWELREAGHTITEPWADRLDNLADDELTPQEAQKFAMLDIIGAIDSDLLIAFVERECCGALIEIGAKIAEKRIVNSDDDVWIIDPYRYSIFWDIPGVVCMTVAEMRKRLGLKK